MLSERELEIREKFLRLAIERTLPAFAKACRDSLDVMIIHQDGFAINYDEYELLGMAIKYAGLLGREIHIIGKNRETLKVAAN